MTLFDIFKRRKERERFRERQKKAAAQAPNMPQDAVAATEKKKIGVSAAASIVLIQPLVTEKSVASNAQGVYSFKVHARATKHEIARAVEELYLVSVRDVRVMNTAQKQRFVRGRPGVRSGFRKAIVALKEGQNIEI